MVWETHPSAKNQGRFHKGKARSWLVDDTVPCMWWQEREVMSLTVF